MNKTALVLVSEIVAQRYVSAPKSAKKTEKGYLKDVIESTFDGLKNESETVDMFQDALTSLKTDAVHSAGFFRELLTDATDKYLSVVNPFQSPEPETEQESDESVLRRLNIDPETMDTTNESVRQLIDAQRKKSSSEYGKREIQKMYESHATESAPTLYPDALEFYPKAKDIQENTPVVERGWHWYSGIQATIGNDWIELLKENDLLDMFSFSEKHIADIAQRAEQEKELNKERAKQAENNQPKSKS